MHSIFGNIDDLYLFCAVVEEGSLLAASRKLQLPVSTLSRRLSALEERLGLRLLEKQRRELVPTQQGTRVFNQLRQGMAHIQQGIQTLDQQSQQVEGRIKVVMPPRFYGDVVGQVIEQFMRDHPKVTLDLILSQAFTAPETDHDLVMTFDIRGMEGIIARPFINAQNAFFVSPEYLQRTGPIETLAQLANQDWVSVSGDTDIPVYQDDQLIDMMTINPRLRINDINAVMHAVEQGFGVASLPLRHIKDELNLTRILPQYHRGKRQSYLVYRHRAYQPRGLTLLIEALLARVSDIPKNAS